MTGEYSSEWILAFTLMWLESLPPCWTIRSLLHFVPCVMERECAVSDVTYLQLLCGGGISRAISVQYIIWLDVNIVLAFSVVCIVVTWCSRFLCLDILDLVQTDCYHCATTFTYTVSVAIVAVHSAWRVRYLGGTPLIPLRSFHSVPNKWLILWRLLSAFSFQRVALNVLSNFTSTTVFYLWCKFAFWKLSRWICNTLVMVSLFPVVGHSGFCFEMWEPPVLTHCWMKQMTNSITEGVPGSGSPACKTMWSILTH